jgi:hypothetical protein
MASGNMIVTLVAQTRKWSSGLQRAAKDTNSFSRIATKGFALAGTALLAIGTALARVIPNLAKMGAESRKADVQLRFMLENMNGVSAATDQTVRRMAEYADQVNRATGIDDEQVKAVQRKLLVFKSLRKTADQLGGTFDRTTAAAIDLAAAGFGEMEQNAIKLGRILENPTKNLNALNRAGIVFTEQEKRKITQLQASGRLFEAQEIVLASVEDRVKGIAEASATPFEKLNAQFQQMGDTIGEAMLPYLEDMNKEISAWLSSPQGKQDLKTIVDGFVDLAKAISGVVGFVIDLMDAWDRATNALYNYNVENSVFKNGGGARGGRRFYGSGGQNGSNQTGPGVVADRQGISAPIINFNAPVDSVSAGREVARVLADYNRSNGRR